MASKEVRIMRLDEVNSHLPVEVVDQAKVKLSSILVHQRPLKGLNAEQEKEYLPRITGVGPDSPDFTQACRKFWAELSVDVPSDGALLEIGTGPDDEPLELRDWIIYQWAKKHKQVADNKQEALENPDREFWIYDPHRETQKENAQVKHRRSAYREFIKMEDDQDKIDLMLRVLTSRQPERMTTEEKENELEAYLRENPKEFISAAKDKKLETRGLIMDLIEHEILQKVGAQIMYMDTVIGDSIDEAVAWFGNKRHSSKVSTMKAKLKEAKR